MKKLLAAVAIAALALTAAAPMVEAAQTAPTVHKTAKPHVHRVAAKKKPTKKPAKKKTSQAVDAHLA